MARELAEYDEQTTGAEPRVAAAAAPHKRQSVAAGAAVGVAVGVGGKPPAGGEGAWTTVLSRRARRQVEKARLDGTSSGAARKAAAARAAATRRTAAVIEYYGKE